MANQLRYTFQVQGADSTPITFSDVDDAKGTVDYGGWDFTGLSPVFTLEDSNKTFVITVDFADSEAGRTAQLAFHTHVMETDSWKVNANSPYHASQLNYDISNSNHYKVNKITDGEASETTY
jgi:hypothetical protein